MEHTEIAAEAAEESRARFTCDPRALSDAIALLASRVIEHRNTIPILSHVLIEALPDGRLILQGTDLDLQATITIAADVEAPGAFCTDAANLKAMLAKLKKMDRDAVAIEHTDTTRAVLVIGRNRFNLPTLPVDDMPTLQSPTVDNRGPMPLSAFTVGRGQLVRDLAALAPCMSTEETRYYLNGVAMQVRELAGQDRLVMVATSGNEIGIASRAVPVGAERLDDCILPRKAVALIGHVAKLAEPTEEIHCERADDASGRFRFIIGNVEIIAKGIDGTFPDWSLCFDEQLAPRSYVEPVLFPDLLPGVPVRAMEKLGKAAGELQWENAYQGRLGSVVNDDDMLFGVWIDPRNSEAPKGYSYVDEHVSFTVDGDSTVYPVATKGGCIHLSAEQVRKIAGDFEAMPVMRADGSTVYISKWLWDDGVKQFGTVQPDGRTFPLHHKKGFDYSSDSVIVTRAEIEAVMVGEIVPADVQGEAAENMPAPDSLAGAESESEPARAQTAVSEIDAERASEPVDIEVNNSEPVATLSEMETVAGLDAQGDAMAAFIGTLDTPTMRIEGPTVDKARRTPAHERAIRRAWANNRLKWKLVHSMNRESEQRMEAVREARKYQVWWEDISRDAAAICADRDRLAYKRRRSTLLARQRGRGLVLMHNVARARLDELQADLAKARQAPTYFDDTGMERTDAAAVAFEQGRHALDKAESLERTVEGAKAVAVRQQRAIEALADELETMTARAIKAERALAAVEARANGHPPAVRSVGVNFRLAS